MNQGGGNKPGGRGGRHRLLGPRGTPSAPAPPVARPAPQPAPQAPAAPKIRVLFVCIGNSCRSQMAEAFARAYGSDLLEVRSAGVAPAHSIAPLTKQTLAAWNLNIDEHFPKDLNLLRHEPFDVAVNMSGMPLGLTGVRTVEWIVPDPIGQKETVYQGVANLIEKLVMRLILDLRTGGV